MLSIIRGAPMHQYDENPRQSPAFEELPYKFAAPARSSPSSPVRETLFENVTPHKNLMANLRRELEPVHYEFDQFSKDLDDTLDKLGDLQVMAEENEEEMDELGKQWVRVSQGINHLRESLTSTQWFLENAFRDYGWANQHEQQSKGESDEVQETPAYRERQSISSTEKHELTSEASALQALKQLQLEMVQIMQGYATLHHELDILESRQKQSEHVMQHTLLDVDEYHLMLEDAQQTLWMMSPEISSLREGGTMMTMESMFEFDKRQQEDPFSEWTRSSTVSCTSAGIGVKTDLDDDVASEWGRSSIMSRYSAAEEEEDRDSESYVNITETMEGLEGGR